MNREITMGSLFDGSGGFPLASAIHGILPVWASEVEKFPIEVTKKRFPHMEHLGDITRIDGAKIRPVDIITFGSPCQDLSVAGKRARLQGFPDWWCADVPHSDTKEYKMWGNGIALPCAAFVIGQVKKHIDEVNYESS